VAPAIEAGRLLEKVRAGQRQTEALSRRLLTMQEEERRRLAVELHDELGQVLTAVKINLCSLDRVASTGWPAHLKDVIASVDGAMDRVRDLALDLRPSVLDDLGLSAALRWYVDRFSRTCRAQVQVSVEGVPRLESRIETACFRIAQEALTNVARHSGARSAEVGLRVSAGRLEVAVVDDGIGLPVPAGPEPARTPGLGLASMRQRAQAVGGDLSVESSGGGTRVVAALPLGAG
jgi:signal transduction histidine kinase